MKHLTRTKITIFFIIIGILLALLTGCNKQVFDFEYTFDKIVCNYDGDEFELKINKWTDYEGEQIQVKSGGKTYMLFSR